MASVTRPWRRNRYGVADGWVEITSERGLIQPYWLRVRAMLPVLWLWTRREVQSRYRQSALRAGWSVVQPAASPITYGWVLTRVLDIGLEPLPYLSFAWAGLVPFDTASSGRWEWVSGRSRTPVR